MEGVRALPPVREKEKNSAAAHRMVRSERTEADVDMEEEAELRRGEDLAPPTIDDDDVTAAAMDSEHVPAAAQPAAAQAATIYVLSAAKTTIAELWKEYTVGLNGQVFSTLDSTRLDSARST